MKERKDKKMVTDGFREYLSNRGLKEIFVWRDKYACIKFKC